MDNKKQTIGFWDRGKGTELHNISTEGFDIGIKSEGEDLYINNADSKRHNVKIIKWHEIWWIRYLVFPLIVLIIEAFVIFQLGFN